MTTLPLDAIKLGERHRTDMGDVDRLALSIQQLGLLHPVVVTASHLLIAGGRRLAAVRRLGWTEVPVTVVRTIDDARSLLEAERDENTCREDMKPSEKVALGRALEALEKPRAAERQSRPGQARSENFTGQTMPPVREIVGDMVGMSGVTYQRAKAVVEAATNEALPEEARAVAEEALRQMDETGKVSRAYEAVREVVPPTKTPPKPLSERHLAAFTRAMTVVVQACLALRDIEVPDSLPAEVREHAAGDLREAVAAANNFRRRLTTEPGQ